jgi:hypothetical protein
MWTILNCIRKINVIFYFRLEISHVMILNVVCVELGVEPNSMDGLQDRTSLKVFKMYRHLWIY